MHQAGLPANLLLLLLISPLSPTLNSLISDRTFHNLKAKYPTNPFTISKLQNSSHDVPELHKIRRSPDLEALKLGKGSSGIAKCGKSLVAISFPDVMWRYLFNSVL